MNPFNCEGSVTTDSPGHDLVAELCTRYHGPRGQFAYAAFAWAQQHVYEGCLPLPLMQWALTPWGACLGFTDNTETDAVITLRPQIWRRGPVYMLDVIAHELLHVYIRWTLGTGAHREQQP